MVLDARFRYAENVRQVVALAAYPIQRIALAPVDLFLGRGELFPASTTALREENSALRIKAVALRPGAAAAGGAERRRTTSCAACSTRRSGCRANPCLPKSLRRHAIRFRAR